MSNEAKPYLVFRVAERHYALPISEVIEVAAMVEPTRLLDAPPALLGYINRRGGILPLIDLHHALHGQPTPITIETLFIVVTTPEHRAALVVDEVLQVQYLAAIDQATSGLIAGTGEDGRIIQRMALASLLARTVHQSEAQE